MTAPPRRPAEDAATAPPRLFTTVGVRFGNGHDGQARVVAAEQDEPYVKLRVRGPRIDEVVQLVWSASGGFREARARVLSIEPDGVWVAVDRAQRVERRLFSRHAPAEPLRASFEPEPGKTVSGAVKDLSLSGLGVWLDARVAEGRKVELVLRRADGREALRTSATVVRITSDSRGVVAGLMFDQVFRVAQTVAQLLGTLAR